MEKELRGQIEARLVCSGIDAKAAQDLCDTGPRGLSGRGQVCLRLRWSRRTRVLVFDLERHAGVLGKPLQVRHMNRAVEPGIGKTEGWSDKVKTQHTEEPLAGSRERGGPRSPWSVPVEFQ